MTLRMRKQFICRTLLLPPKSAFEQYKQLLGKPIELQNMHPQLLMAMTIKCLSCLQTPGKGLGTAGEGTMPQDSYQGDEPVSSGLKNKTNSLVHFPCLISIRTHITNHTIIEEKNPRNQVSYR